MFLLLSVVKTAEVGRSDKALSVFNVVTFPNSVCAATSGYNGTCYTSSECTSKGGSADGNCAAGFGVCCLITTSTCSSTISTNTTYIRNPKLVAWQKY